MCKNLVIYTDVSFDEQWMGIGYAIYRLTDTFEQELLELGNRVIDHSKLDREYDSYRAEVRALITGVRAATDYGNEQLLCNVDIDHIGERIHRREKLDDDGYFIHAVRSFLGRFNEWRVNSISRDHNEVAHKQAQAARDAAIHAQKGLA